MSHSSCPSCNAPVPPPFYELQAIPISSNRLAPSREEAVQMPRGELSLACCSACGFITNTRFDPAHQQLSAQYEATQGFSGTFNAFARTLAQRWARDYLRPGAVALEIGCGKGEFVTLLHEVSGCRAIGFDPTLAAASAPDAPVTLMPELYSERSAHIGADLVVCRHTLEHIPNVGAFVRMIRTAIGDRSATVVAIEVPDTLRLLREGAFWDLYYEHCSYFTPGSLARLFRAAGLDVINLRLEFDQQYIILEARPQEHSLPRFELEDDHSAIDEAVDGFPSASERQLSRWRRIIDDTLAEGRRIALWGSGSKAVGFLSTLDVSHERLPHVVDINPRKQGTFLPGTGQEIVAPAVLREHRVDAVIVMNPVYLAEIRAELERMDLAPELFALG